MNMSNEQLSQGLNDSRVLLNRAFEMVLADLRDEHAKTVNGLAPQIRQRLDEEHTKQLELVMMAHTALHAIVGVVFSIADAFGQIAKYTGDIARNTSEF